MRKTITFLLCASLLAIAMCGCSEDLDEQSYPDPQTRASNDDGDGDEIDLEDLYFDPESGMWLIPTDDSNDDSGDNTESGAAMQLFSISFPPITGGTPPPIGPGFIDIIVAKYLKIWPKNEEQLEQLLAMDDVIISFHPLTAVPVPTAIRESLGLINRGTAISNIRYYEQVDEYTDNDGNTEPARLVAMPVLYAEWPNWTPYPDWMDYIVTGNKTESMANPVWPSNNGSDDGSNNDYEKPSPYYPVITVMAYDSLLSKYVNIPNADILIQGNTHNQEQGRTDMNGRYRCKNKYYKSSNLTITVYWSHPNFYVRKNGRWAEYTVSASVSSYVSARLPSTIHGTIFRAAQFWFDNAAVHGLATGVGKSGKIMKFFDDTDATGPNGAAGSFHYNLSRTHIHMYKNTDTKSYFCTALHELGHGSMFRYKGNWRYSDTDGMIKEGWACFTGWYVPAKAYIQWGYTGDPWNSNLVGPTRHRWEKSGTENTLYSPLFIDLMDDNNQGVTDTRKSNDNIKNVPVWVIQDLAFGSYGCASFDGNARRCNIANGYYTQQDYDNYFAAYQKGWK